MQNLHALHCDTRNIIEKMTKESFVIILQLIFYLKFVIFYKIFLIVYDIFLVLKGISMLKNYFYIVLKIY